jgi:putative exosortase-associated protein (TIGR04073 family)
MRNKLALYLLCPALLLGAVGCANTQNNFARTETKFGRGFNNAFEIIRGGEFRRSFEQTSVFDGSDSAMSTGFFRGINRTFARTGLGIYEMVTAPLPPYKPVWTGYLAPGPVYPDNYAPSVMEDSMTATDTRLGYSGGAIFPMIPGNRFRVFDEQ